MGNSAFTAKISGSNWVDQTFTMPVDIVQGQQYILASSDLVTNSAGQRGLKVVLEFSDITPNVPGASFTLGLVVEGKNDQGGFFPIGYTFSQINYNGAHAFKRVIEVDPNLDTFNLGIDDSIYVAGEEITRISRNRGFVPDEGFRLCLILKDNNTSGPSAFQSCTCTITGEQYDA